MEEKVGWKLNAMVENQISRRGFFRKGGVAVAGVVGASQVLNSVQGQESSRRRNSGKIRMGIAGGRFGLQFQWHEHPDCIVEAVTDLIPERRQALM